MKEFITRYWKWIAIAILIGLGLYLSAWFYYNMVKTKKNKGEETSGTT